MTRRASRTLIGVLSFTTIVGLSAYAISHRNRPQSNPSDKQQTSAQTTPLTPLSVVASPATTRPVVMDIVPSKSRGEEREAKPASVVQPPASSKGVLAEGEAKIKSGDILAGRKLLNDTLVNGQFSEADAAAAKKLISEANKEIVFSTKRFSDDIWQGTHTVAKGESLAKIASPDGVTQELLSRINGIPDPRRLRAGATIKTIQGPFHIVVTKHTFTMDIYLGSPGEKGAQYITSYGVGLGREDSTPTGTWTVEQRIAHPKYYSPRGEGTVEAQDPRNPLGDYWIALTGTDGNAVGKLSYGIHGTIDPSSIGKMASMGCIRMHNEDVAIVFELVAAGKSTVVVKD